MSMKRKYLIGTLALAARPAAGAEVVGGTNWWQVFYNPKGIIDDAYNNPKTKMFVGPQAQNTGWANQLTASKTNTAAFATQQQTAQQQLRAALVQQQAANTAALQRQFAAAFPNAGMPQAGAGAYTMPGSMPGMVPNTGLYQQPAPQQQYQPAADPNLNPDGSAIVSSTVPDTSDVVGGYSTIGGALPQQFVVIAVKNMPDVIKKQSSLGGLAFGALPKTVSDVAYSKMAAQILASLSSSGVDADVSVTTAAPSGRSTKDLLFGVGVGAIGFAAVFSLVKLATHKKKR